MGSLAHRYEKQNVLLFVSKPINYTPASVQTAVQTVNSLLQLPVTLGNTFSATAVWIHRGTRKQVSNRVRGN